MMLRSFTDELVRHGVTSFTKTARLLSPRSDRLVERMAATGALSSGAMHGVAKARASMTADPYDGPQGSLSSALARGAIGGLVAALGLKALTRMHGRR